MYCTVPCGPLIRCGIWDLGYMEMVADVGKLGAQGEAFKRLPGASAAGTERLQLLDPRVCRVHKTRRDIVGDVKRP